MRWEELNDEDAKAKARQVTGLGASQTAEVAYLETWNLLENFFLHLKMESSCYFCFW